LFQQLDLMFTISVSQRMVFSNCKTDCVCESVPGINSIQTYEMLGKSESNIFPILLVKRFVTTNCIFLFEKTRKKFCQGTRLTVCDVPATDHSNSLGIFYLHFRADSQCIKLVRPNQIKREQTIFCNRERNAAIAVF